MFCFRKLHFDIRVVEESTPTERSKRLFRARRIREVNESGALFRKCANEADRTERTHRRAKFLSHTYQTGT